MKKILLRSLVFTVFFASLLMFFSILLSSDVSAACCINSNAKSCSFVSDTVESTQTCESVGGLYDVRSCSEIDSCKVGCCCEQRQAMSKISCNNQNSFEFNEVLGEDYQSGDSCSCGNSFPISGTVYDKNGLALGGATVSVGDKVNISALEGANVGSYTLFGVPQGSNPSGAVVITASKDGCQASVVVQPFLSARSGISINLICNCIPGCDINRNSYCDGEQRVHFYNLDNAQEEIEYCQFCGANDAVDCGSSAPLCQNGDNYCPLGCSATGQNSDSDCVCNPTTANGVCPAGCTNEGVKKDIDCGYSPNVVCGDHIISYPFETCEKTPLIPSSSSCNPLSCNAVSCQCNSNSLCGNNQLNANEECEGSVCSDGSPCNGCKCGQVCSTSNKNPVLGNPIYNRTTNAINLQWSLSNNCSALVINTEIYLCVGNSAECTADSGNFNLYETVYGVSSHSIGSVDENTQYFFYVVANYNLGAGASLGTGKSTIKSIKTGDYFCMNRPLGSISEFCLENKKQKCDSNFNLLVLEDCTISDVNRARFCVGPDVFNQVSCQDSNPCLSCNGLYGLFAKYIDLKIPIGSEDHSCSYAGPAIKVVPGCFFEQNNGFIVGSFKTCDKVKTCYDFKSQNSCTDVNDPCGLNAFSNRGCEWAALGASPSLGVCRPKDKNVQDCTVCDDPLKNPISPKCTPQACSLFGTSCNFQGAQNTPSCSSNAVKTCNSYGNITQCIGTAPNARAVSVDAIYNSSNARIGGTHAVILSLDNSSLGKCYWDASGNRCRRNADNLPASAGAEGFDCQNNPGCESDFVNPITTITSFTRNANPVFKYSVSDNFHPASAIKTFFCITTSDLTCYPTELGVLENGERVYKPGNFSGTQHYKLFYYSEDGSKNLELIKQLPLIIDGNEPFIELISPRNDSQIAVNTNLLNIVGKTSADILFMCVKNPANGFVTCPNRCDNGGGPNCIKTTDSGADFNISVRINATSGTPAQLISNLIIEATDLVGNKYSNSLNGIIFDITPPREPKLRIK